MASRAGIQSDSKSQDDSELDSPYAPILVASSRACFEKLQPKQAKTEQVGFLDLPHQVRLRIYELSIFDHDRGAVFLPRNHPRKVVSGIDDVEVVCVGSDCEAGLPTLMSPKLVACCIASSTLAEETAAAGQWVGTDSSNVEDPLQLGIPYEEVKLMLDGKIEELLDASDASVMDGSETGGSPVKSAMPPARSPRAEGNTEQNDASDSLSDIDLDENLSDGTADDTSDEDEDDEEPEYEESDDEYSDDEGSDDEVGWHDQKISQWDDYAHDTYEENVFHQGEDQHFDDIEHFDGEETIGMLYEPREPAILLVCKEIRAEALAIYYSQNAFSWRFQWTDYARSCRRFKSWTRAITPENAKLITKLTFQGRHIVEEGVEFSIDIDTTDHHPFFEVGVYTRGDMGVDLEISETLNRQTAKLLWRMVQTNESRPVLTAELLCELANIFVQSMHQDAGGCISYQAEDLRLILSPLF